MISLHTSTKYKQDNDSILCRVQNIKFNTKQ